jgi:hypothetical protein
LHRKAIFAKGSQSTRILEIDKDSAATGGRLIHNNNDLAGALKDLASAPAVSYSLGLSGGRPGREISRSQGVARRAEPRPGYIAAIPAKDKGAAQQRIDILVSSHTMAHDVPATVHVIPTAKATGGYTVKIVVDVDARRIRFASRGKLHLQQLTFVTAIRECAG